MRRVLFVVLMSLGFGAAAELSTGDTPSSSRTRLEPALKNRTFEENQLLTDPKLRAEEGSMSRFSAKFNVSYFGPTLNDLSAKDQPNPDGGRGPYETSLGGSISGRYRLSSVETMSLGTGLKAVHPFHGIERFDVNNPYVSYDLSSKIGGVQMRNSPGLSVITLPAFRDIGEYAGLTYSNSLIYDFNSSPVAVGLETSIGYYLYNRGYEPADGKANRYQFSLSPNIKYRFTDKINVNASYSYSYWNLRSNEQLTTLQSRTPTLSLGLGYSLTKEVYLAPYLYMYPTRVASDMTTFNMSAIFSVL